MKNKEKYKNQNYVFECFQDFSTPQALHDSEERFCEVLGTSVCLSVLNNNRGILMFQKQNGDILRVMWLSQFARLRH